MLNQIEFKVYGKYALFSDPLTRIGGEKCSYQIPTYEALKGIVKAVYWKPTLIWLIDEVRIMRPIRLVPKNMKLIKYHEAGADLSVYTYKMWNIKSRLILNGTCTVRICPRTGSTASIMKLPVA